MIIGNIAVLSAIQSLFDGRRADATPADSQVRRALTIAGAVDGGITVSGRQKDAVKINRQRRKHGIKLRRIGDALVLVDDGELSAAILADVERGQLPVVVVGVHRLNLVVGIVVHTDAAFELGANIHQHLNHPNQPHLLRVPPGCSRLVEHLAVEGHALFGVGLDDHIEGHVDNLGRVSATAKGADGNAAVFLQIGITGQIVVGAADLDLQHRRQLDVAVVVVHVADVLPVVAIGVSLLITDVEEGLRIVYAALIALDLTLFVAAWPIQNVEGVPKVVRVGRSHLKFDIGRRVGRQAVDGQVHRCAAAKDLAFRAKGLAARLEGGLVDGVGHPVAVDITVGDIGRAVAVAVRTVGSGQALLAVEDRIVQRAGLLRIAVK